MCHSNSYPKKAQMKQRFFWKITTLSGLGPGCSLQTHLPTQRPAAQRALLQQLSLRAAPMNCFKSREVSAQPTSVHRKRSALSWLKAFRRTSSVATLEDYASLDRLAELLNGGDVALIRASYILTLRKEGGIFPTRQDLPSHALVDATMLQRVLAELEAFARSDQKWEMFFLGLVVVSYCWGSKEHPDATGQMLRDVLAPAVEWYLSERAGVVMRRACWAAGATELTDELLDFAVFIECAH